MTRLAFALFLIALPFMANDCTIDNIGDFVVTYDVTVTNTSSEEATVSFLLPDNKQRRTLAPGGAATVTGFKAGNVLISVAPKKEYIADLTARRDALVKKLDAKGLQFAVTMQLYNELNIPNANIRDYESRGHGSLCVGELAAAKGPKKLSFTVTGDFEKLNCAGG